MYGRKFQTWASSPRTETESRTQIWTRRSTKASEIYRGSHRKSLPFNVGRLQRYTDLLAERKMDLNSRLKKQFIIRLPRTSDRLFRLTMDSPSLPPRMTCYPP
eukprot:1190078-Prorocentrum_minimum.AAC.2